MARSDADLRLSGMRSVHQERPERRTGIVEMLHERPCQRVPRQGGAGRRIRVRKSRTLRSPFGSAHIIHGPCILRQGQGLPLQAGCGHCKLPSRRINSSIRPDQQILHDLVNAGSLIKILEHGTRQHPRSGTPGRGRNAGDERARPQHGMAPQMYRSRPRRRHP